MTLKEFLSKIEKENCPPECEFSCRNDIEIARVLPPDEVLGILVSQDPTISWLHFYKNVNNEPQEHSRRQMLFASAIPKSLFNRIIEFMDKRINGEDEKHLFNILFKKVYWTHLHKCFTDGKGTRSIKFKPSNAKECAEKWLAEELNIAINDKIKFIIALGNNVHGWLKKQNITNRNREVKIIKLPHPGGLCRKWNNKADPEVSGEIEELLSLCREYSDFSPREFVLSSSKIDP
jgi:hypothetical protein